MASRVDNINATIDGIFATLAADAANPQPSYTIDGQQVDRNGWRAALQAQIEFLRRQIVIEQPYEEVMRGTS